MVWPARPFRVASPRMEGAASCRAASIPTTRARRRTREMLDDHTPPYAPHYPRFGPVHRRRGFLRLDDRLPAPGYRASPHLLPALLLRRHRAGQDHHPPRLDPVHRPVVPELLAHGARLLPARRRHRSFAAIVRAAEAPPRRARAAGAGIQPLGAARDG